jgi:hypothetical protein
VLYVIAGIADAEAPPNQIRDTLRGPDWRVESVCDRALLKHLAQSRQFFGRQFRAGASRFRSLPEHRIAACSVAPRPSLNRLDGDTKTARNRRGGLSVPQPCYCDEPALL